MRKLVLGMAMASSALASPALARDGQWYVELGAGPMIVEDIDFDIGSASDAISADVDRGWDAGGVVGYDFGPFRLEAEASYRQADLESLTSGTVGIPAVGPGLNTGRFDANGELNVLSFMLNGLLDFGDDDSLQGFVGGGVGVARTDIDGTIQASSAGAFDDSDTGFAWQVLAGVRAPLTETIDVGLRYRLFNADSVGLVDVRGRGLDSDIRSHSILGTLAFNFGGAEEVLPEPVAPAPEPYVAPPAPPAPTPPPQAVCETGPYIVFFNWDSAEITSDAAQILDSAASAYANCGNASVMLAGYTDTSGTVQYNLGLAARRNASVRDYLTSRGIGSGQINSQAFGEANPRVPTADGVRELQNRRVEITYGPGSGM